MVPPPQRTLLVLGSKPAPVIPPPQSYAAIACANGSGFSARAHGLATPLFTVISAMLGSGKDSEQHTLAVMRGLRTQTLYFLPRRKPLRRKDWRMHPLWVRWLFWRGGYRYERFEDHPSRWYEAHLVGLCGGDRETTEIVERKRMSTGLIAAGLGLSLGRFDHVILSGFDLTLEHAYGENPRIAKRKMTKSLHELTDLHVLRTVTARRPGALWTTEPNLHERARIPLLTP